MFLKILATIGIWLGLSTIIYGILFLLAKKRLPEEEYNISPIAFCSLISAICLGVAIYIIFI